MINKILCPLDGSFLSDEILPQLKRILYRQDADVLLLRVLPDPSGSFIDEWEVEAHKAHQHLENTKKLLAAEGARVRTEYRTGNDAAQEIDLCAGDWKPSMIAMSTHGRSGIDRWVRGSVCERVLQRTQIPILALNPLAAAKNDPPRETCFRRILVPVDGSERSAAVLPMVADLARLYGSTAILFYVAPLPRAPGVDPVLLKQYTAQEALPVLESYRKALVERQIETRVATGAGHPAEEILLATERGGCDLVAMTTHGRTGLAKWRYGSVAEQVLRHIRYPLLLLRTASW